MNVKMFANFLYLGGLLGILSGKHILQRNNGAKQLEDQVLLPKNISNMESNLSEPGKFRNSNNIDPKSNSDQEDQNKTLDIDEKPLYVVYIPLKPRRLISINTGNGHRLDSSKLQSEDEQANFLSRKIRSYKLCQIPKNLKYASIHCHVHDHKIECKQECSEGYSFMGHHHRKICCSHRDGLWVDEHGMHLCEDELDCACRHPVPVGYPAQLSIYDPPPRGIPKYIPPPKFRR